MSLSDKPSASPIQADASDGILSPEKQAELETAQSAVLASIAKIKNPMARFRAQLAVALPVVKALVEFAGAYPGAAPFVGAISHGIKRIEETMRDAGARADG